MTDRPILVMTYNILGARHQEGLGKLVRQVRPDVLLVNETPKLPVVSYWQCRRLARDWGLRFRTGGRSAGSTMIVTSDRVAMISASARRIPQPFSKPRRGVAAIQAELDGQPIGFVGCHLSLVATSRVHEVAEYVLVAADRLEGPVVLAGDLNETPGKPAWQRILDAGFVDHGGPAELTFPAVLPTRRIDAVLVRGDVTCDVTVFEHRVPDVDPSLFAQASDHRPVTALIQLTQTAT
ncbi:MAG: endonuclease/exonuclease/phosphatase family protein [Nocardioidaceae bacterium]